MASLIEVGDGVALVERVDGGGEGVEGSELDGLAEAFEVQDGGPHGFHALADLIDAVRVEEAVAGGRLEQQVQRHLAGGWRRRWLLLVAGVGGRRRG